MAACLRLPASRSRVGRDENRETDYPCTTDDALLTLIATNSRTGYQTTTYVYGTTLADSGVGGGNAVNDVQRVYNDFRQLATEYQAHTGLAVPGTTPAVNYGYADGSGNSIRLETLNYGTAVTYQYGEQDSMADLLSRVETIQFNSQTAAYSYLGLGTIVQAAYAEPSLAMTYIKQGVEPVGDAGDQYTGLDRFGRIVDNRWLHGAAADADRIKYGYDAASNRIWRQNTVAATGQDEFYTQDGVYQLDEFQRGTLNTGHTGLTGTPAWEEDFTYDETGNWQNYSTRTNGAPGLDQPRTHNEANETTSLSGSAALVSYDRGGNMTTCPQPGQWSAGYELTFDAWNRLTKVTDGATIVASYAYDGLTRRIRKTVGTTERRNDGGELPLLRRLAGAG